MWGSWHRAHPSSVSRGVLLPNRLHQAYLLLSKSVPMSVSRDTVRAAITKHQSWVAFKEQTFISHRSGGESPRSRHQPFHRQPPSCLSSLVEGVRELSGLLHKPNNPTRVPPPRPLPNTIPLRVRFQHMNLGWTQTIAINTEKKEKQKKRGHIQPGALCS